MTQFCDEISELAKILRCNGDKVLDASCKLSLPTSFIHKFNKSWSYFCKNKNNPFQTSDYISSSMKDTLDLQILYDFIQKTVALKILPELNVGAEPYIVDLQFFNSLRLLEINRLSLSFIGGLKSLRSHLEYIICNHSLSNLNDILEYCGADKSQGYVWSHLKKAVFSYNCLSNLDASLEFIPKLEILDLSHNNLIDAHMINCLPSLTNLNLSYNKLEAVPPFNGSICNNLRSLCLHSNFIEDIKGLSSLINLQELDLSKNCLLTHYSLAALSCLPYLKWLNLLGNPLSFHPQHRLLTIRYLHLKIASSFTLDHVLLTDLENRDLTYVDFVVHPISRSSSFNSEVTDNTVIIDRCKDFLTKKNSLEFSEDIGSSSSKSISVMSSSLDDNNCITNNPLESDTSEEVVETITDKNFQMQDSGFFAGTRPISPSQSSIGSASSLFSEDVQVLDNHYESDIEVLTNPSQSSIEVLEQDSRETRFSPS